MAYKPFALTLLAQLLVFLVLPGLTQASATAVQLDNNSSSISLGPYIQYKLANDDETHPNSLKELPDTAWQPSLEQQINLGFKTSTFWFKTTIQTTDLASKQWLIEQSYALIDEISVYVFQNSKLLNEWHTGDKQAFIDRPLNHAHFLFPLALESNSEYQVFIRVKNTEAMELPLKLIRFDVFTTADNKRSVIDGIFYGFLIIMAAYNLVLFLNIRDIGYLYYVAYVMGMLLFFMSQKGLLFQLFFPESPLVHHYSIPLILIFTLNSVAFFIKEFLGLDKHTPKAWIALKIILAINSFAIVLVFFLPYHISIFMIIANLSIGSTLVLLTALYLSRKGQRTAQMILSGWSLLISCAVFMTLSKIGIIYNEFMAQYGLRLGTSFEILIFSFALSYRINEERQAKELALRQANLERSERIKAQDLALQHEVEARKAKETALAQQKSLNENLEQIVQERTATLEKALTDLERANKELEHLSTQDGLTGLYNRRAFDLRIAEEWARSYRNKLPISLLMIDIDHFKQINDNKGHPCGDYVLQEISKEMQSIISRPTDFISRYGGEEFAVVLHNTPKSGAEHVADALVKHMGQHSLQWENIPFTITISIGLHTMVATEHSKFEALISAADGALYNAKQNGRNQWVSVS